jgi:hypothetical protein
MKHQEFVRDLGAFYDRELSVSRMAEVRAHIQDCASCREAHEHWEKIAQSCFPEPAPLSKAQTEMFIRRVMSQVKPPQKKRFLFPELNLWKFLVPALSFCVVLFAIFSIFERTDYPTSMDALLLIDPQNKSVAELILPPDATRENNLLASVMEGK